MSVRKIIQSDRLNNSLKIKKIFDDPDTIDNHNRIAITSYYQSK